MAQATANFELGTPNSGILAADPGSATAWDVVSNDAPGTNFVTYNNTHMYGALSAKFDNTGSAASGLILTWTTGIGTLTNYYGRVYLWADSNPSTSFRVVRDGSNLFPVQISSAGKVQQYDAGGFIHETTASIALSQWVRIEWHWINSATVGQAEVKLFNSPDSATPTETKTSAANRDTGASTTQLDFGLGSGGAAGPIWLDNIVAGATSYPGPVSTPAPDVLAMQAHVFGHGVW